MKQVRAGKRKKPSTKTENVKTTETTEVVEEKPEEKVVNPNLVDDKQPNSDNKSKD